MPLLLIGALGFGGAPRAPLSRAAAWRAGPRMAHALIVQNKGGGHGEIAFHLAKALRAKGVDVTIVQDAAAKASKPPFSRYESELSDCSIAWCDPTDSAAVAAALAGRPALTHVFDNFAKSPAECAPALDAALASPAFQLFAFVSSAGMYTAKGELREDGPVKDPPTGQREVELALAEKLPGRWCAFRPQYIYGAHARARASGRALQRAPSAHSDVSMSAVLRASLRGAADFSTAERSSAAPPPAPRAARPQAR